VATFHGIDHLISLSLSIFDSDLNLLLLVVIIFIHSDKNTLNKLSPFLGNLVSFAD